VRGFWRGHRLLYALTGGRLGLRPPTADRYGMLVLRTLGRRSGKERQAILAYFEDGRDLVIVPMNGWAAPEPAWWLNLQAQPEATVDMPDGTRLVRARLADPEEHARLWATAAAGPWGQDMDAYAVGRGRDTAIVMTPTSPLDCSGWQRNGVPPSRPPSTPRYGQGWTSGTSARGRTRKRPASSACGPE
jgi:deazaflavin-dependent oxidoreductase (nitroreductase family)